MMTKEGEEGQSSAPPSALPPSVHRNAHSARPLDSLRSYVIILAPFAPLGSRRQSLEHEETFTCDVRTGLSKKGMIVPIDCDKAEEGKKSQYFADFKCECPFAHEAPSSLPLRPDRYLRRA